MTPTEAKDNKFLTVSLADAAKLCEGMKASELDEACRELDHLTVMTARMSAYLSMRSGHGCGDQGHDAAVKHQNKVAAKVRKALGFTYPKQDINF